jgi:hypothetical protein
MATARAPTYLPPRAGGERAGRFDVAIVGMVMMLVGFVIGIAGGVMLLIEAFREHVLWGLGTLLFGVVGLVFALLHWDRAGKPLLLNIGGALLIFLGALLGAAGHPHP